MKKLRVTVEGKAYDVLVEILDAGPVAAPAPVAPPPVQSAPLAAPVAAPAPTAAPAAAPAPVAPKAAPVAAGANDIVSPLSGKVVSIDVKVGDAVAAGAKVAVVEAMKMNTDITATHAGKVLSIHATVGEGIEEGAVMIKLG